MSLLRAASAALLTLAAASAAAKTTAAPAALYQLHCASCHGGDRLGGMGPALLPESLARMEPAQARAVVADGRPATQMPAFRERLADDAIEALVELIYTPLAEPPSWGIAEIAASRVVQVPAAELVARPRHAADPLNLFIVVELGDHHATLLDGDRLEPIHRFATRFALHGGPKFSPDGRFVYFMSRDGWVSKFDLWGLATVAEVRAGINSRNLAASADGRYLLVGNRLPHSLVLLDAESLAPLRVIPVVDEEGRSSRVSAVYTAPPRRSFIAALKDLPEIWEIGYADDPLPVYDGPMHDYRLGEGAAPQTGPFAVRRIRLDDPLDDFFFDPDYRLLIGAARNARNGQVVQLDVGRKIAELELDGMPHLGSGITWEYQGRRVLATPHLGKAEISVIDMQSWQTIKRIPTAGPGFFMRSHERSRYAWADVFFGPRRDVVHLIDKQTLEIARTLRPAPGRTAAHVEFDRDGRHALLSIWEDEGAVVIYDAATLVELKRLPMRKPSGKYNVWNKIRRSEGTSH